MPNKKKKQHRLLTLWQKADGRCCWCGEPTILIFRGRLYTDHRDYRHRAPRRPDEATIEHLESRLDGRRQVQGEIVWAIACYQCNHDRARAQVAALGLDELRRRSQRH